MGPRRQDQPHVGRQFRAALQPVHHAHPALEPERLIKGIDEDDYLRAWLAGAEHGGWIE
jgi:hypothetical protein